MASRQDSVAIGKVAKRCAGGSAAALSSTTSASCIISASVTTACDSGRHASSHSAWTPNSTDSALASCASILTHHVVSTSVLRAASASRHSSIRSLSCESEAIAWCVSGSDSDTSACPNAAHTACLSSSKARARGHASVCSVACSKKVALTVDATAAGAARRVTMCFATRSLRERLKPGLGIANSVEVRNF